MSESKYNGLTAWRERQAEARRLRLLELEHYRESAKTEIRGGRVYRVVTIPDIYDYERERPRREPPVQFRRTKKRT